MTDYAPPLRDLAFVLNNVIDLDELCELEAFDHVEPETVTGLLEEFGRLCADVLSPLNRSGDVEGSHHHADGSVTTPEGFPEAYAKYRDGGWGGVAFPSHYGGGSFPWVVNIALQELMTSANTSFSMCPLLTQGAIDLLLHHGSETQREIYLPKMVTGEWTGTMNLTEPDAGSDVGALRTKAEPAGDGSYRISGNKIFITFGDHDLTEQIIHLVLARTPGAPVGTKGISCFIVPKFLVNDDGSLGERNAVKVLSIEHKMGINASPTCVMEYDGATGFLIGEENAGMKYMFTMMNNARLSVGLQGLSLAERSYQAALAYAQERRQGRAPGAPKAESSRIIEHPDVRRMLLTMRAYIDAMRAIVFLNAEALDLAQHHPMPEMRAAKQDLADLLTPITKALCTDLGVEVTSLAIQIHGGMGFIEEAGVSQYYRDARIAPIYEGTNGIQAMDLVGRKLPMEGGEVVKNFIATMAATDEWLEHHGERFATIRENLAAALESLVAATAWMFEHGLTDPRDALAGATPYLRMFGLTVGGWLLADAAVKAREQLKAGDGDAGYLDARIEVARFYCEQLLPAAPGLLGPVTAGAGRLYSIDIASL